MPTRSGVKLFVLIPEHKLEAAVNAWLRQQGKWFGVTRPVMIRTVDDRITLAVFYEEFLPEGKERSAK